MGKSCDQAARAIEAPRPIGCIESIKADTFVGGWGMNEPPITDIDADMRETLTRCIEEDQIARHEFPIGDFTPQT